MDFPQLAHVPPPSGRRIAVHVTSAAERAVRHGHPWLFDRSIRSQNRNGRCGDLAVLFDQNDRFLAIGLHDPTSPIRVRVLHQGDPTPINRAWLQHQIETAARRRQSLPDNTNGYRLIHGGNDHLSGLVIDRYAGTYVLKLYTAAWIPHLRDVAAALIETAAPQRIALRLSRTVQAQPALLFGLADGMLLWGAPLSEPVRFREHGLRFEVDVVAGQKTGFFLDQRENRARLEALVQPGDAVLNVFAYSGGFSLYAARGGAAHVVSQDLSRPALAAAARNFALNGNVAAIAAADHDLLAGDAFQALQQLGANGRFFDVVVIDPPSFAHNREQVPRALAAYARLVRRGLAVLRPQGTLVMASCSSRVAAGDFFELVHKIAQEVERPLRKIARTGHPLDHPIHFPESAYLKCLFATAA